MRITIIQRSHKTIRFSQDDYHHFNKGDTLLLYDNYTDENGDTQQEKRRVYILSIEHFVDLVNGKTNGIILKVCDYEKIQASIEHR